jgi:hypothetical protein
LFVVVEPVSVPKPEIVIVQSEDESKF